MSPAQRLSAAEALIKALRSGIRIVDQTFYRDPPLPEFTKEQTEAVVRTMLFSIDLYEGAPR